MGDNNVIERKAFIFNKQKYNMYDGPGVRTLVFFKGCPLRDVYKRQEIHTEAAERSSEG